MSEMKEYVQSILDLVAKKDPNQVEYQNTVKEVLTTILPVLEKHPEYRKAKILERMVEPERVIMRTWRWLGVNEAKVGEALLMDTEEKIITVPEGSRNSLVVVYRRESHGQLKIRLEEGAELSLTRVQLLPGDALHAGSVEAVVAAGARFHYTAVEAGGAASVTKLTVDLQGDESAADVAALYLGDGQRSIDMNYLIRQQGKNTTADMQVRGALLGESRKIFRGTLDFLRGAKGSQGHGLPELVASGFERIVFLGSGALYGLARETCLKVLELTAGKIAAVSETVMDILLRCKPADKVILVSDAISASGLADGDYVLGVEPVHVKNGIPHTDSGSLAGSTTTLLAEVRRLICELGKEPLAVVHMASLNPSRRFGLDQEIGSIRPGKRADFLIVDKGYQLQEVWKDGVKVVQK